MALFVGAAITKLLSLTKLDNRAATEWGLESMLEGPQGERRSIEKMAGGVVKWVILLFGFVAFFNALNLQMVAGPLQNVVDKIVGIIPNLLKAAVILFIYWAVATLAKMGITKGLNAVRFDERASAYLKPREVKGELVGSSGLVGRLLFYVILLFGLCLFLC